MKKIDLLLMCFVIALVSISCSSDDDANVAAETNNFLKIGGTEYELRAGAIENFGSFNNLTNFDITLVDTNIVIVNGQPVPENNIVNLINFELFTDSNQDLLEGEYPLVDFSEITGQSFEYAAILENIDISSETEVDEPPFLVEGSLQVISNGPEYEIEFSGVDNLGRQISGFYKGSLITVN
ncbi:hypothetical protein [Flavobacteriaceae bacterium 14752]|uniref:hypothetical protein n=1 Tax=Mesohalobacter salilacus TaxID=2491711 RepID=UPI000F63CCE8|nr:hypothetical protein EIG84_08635 [Flavobacteriaceae bacterium 14752]